MNTFKKAEPHYKQYLNNPYAVHCKTHEEWDRVRSIIDCIYGEDLTYLPREGKEYVSLSGYGIAKGRTVKLGLLKEHDYKIISCAEFFGMFICLIVSIRSARIFNTSSIFSLDNSPDDETFSL